MMQRMLGLVAQSDLHKTWLGQHLSISINRPCRDRLQLRSLWERSVCQRWPNVQVCIEDLITCCNKAWAFDQEPNLSNQCQIAKAFPVLPGPKAKRGIVAFIGSTPHAA